MSDVPGDDPVLLVEADDEPADSDAHLFDDSAEGADEGVPVLSTFGSEMSRWGTDA